MCHCFVVLVESLRISVSLLLLYTFMYVLYICILYILSTGHKYSSLLFTPFHSLPLTHGSQAQQPLIGSLSSSVTTTFRRRKRERFPPRCVLKSLQRPLRDFLYISAILKPIASESNIIIAAAANKMGNYPGSPEAYGLPKRRLRQHSLRKKWNKRKGAFATQPYLPHRIMVQMK